MKTRFIKLSADGEKLRSTAKDWRMVLDQSTGLEWLLDDPGRMNWKSAKAWAKDLRIGGSVWRLPTILEYLSGPVDYSRSSPAVDLRYFRGFEANWYWTSTPYAGSPSVYAWFVYFGDGSASWFNQSSFYCVRAVRPSQSLALGSSEVAT